MVEVGTAYASGPASRELAAGLLEQMGVSHPTLIVVFAEDTLDGATLAKELGQGAPLATVIACSTAGEFTERKYGTGGVAAMAFGAGVVVRAAAALASFENGIDDGIQRASQELARAFGRNLRDLDPERHVGLLLFEGLSQNEDDGNAAIGHVAPFLSFVGGSAGDGRKFQRTWICVDGELQTSGAAIALLETVGPTRVLKTSSFLVTETVFEATRVEHRLVHELDGAPAAEVYARAIGTDVGRLEAKIWSRHPLGVVISGDPWVRSVRAVTPEHHLLFASRVHQGSRLHLLKPGDVLADTARALKEARASLSGPVRAGIFFNCMQRRLLIEALEGMPDFHRLFAEHPSVGFHCYGESYLAHINSSMVGLLFG